MKSSKASAITSPSQVCLHNKVSNDGPWAATCDRSDVSARCGSLLKPRL
ncbi:MAG: hypothetical protein ACTS46_00750 [Candidatus Hodgkinia cicadicola]